MPASPASSSSPTTHEPLRWDIQVLRGLAVAWVLLHHAQLPGVGAGFLGVDIFFVISGYLITGLVQRALQAQRFSFAAFYARRARRLLPAAYVTLALTALASPWLLNAAEQIDLAAQLRGALLFASNWVLWQQSGYFQGAAELKPLLHFWSLSLEEQYYLLLPALLVITPARWRWRALLGLCLLSLAWCAATLQRDASAAFYGLPSRAWELGLGSLAALWRSGRADAAARRWPSALAWVALLSLPLLPAGHWPHPGALAALVGLATAWLMLSLPAAANAPAALRPMVWLGDRSYSLYLLHWPLMAAVNNAWIGTEAGQPPALLAWRLAALALAFPAAWALHRWVELPGKRWLTGRRGLLALLAASLLLAALPWLCQRLGRPGGAPDFAQLSRPNHGFAPSCDAEQPYAPRPECQQGARPGWMVWGDSYAMHLVPGLAKVAGEAGLLQASKSSCGPFVSLVPYRPELAAGQTFAPAWTAQCRAFNAAVLDWLAAHPEVHTVLLSSLLSQYLDAGRYQLRRFDAQGHVIATVAGPEAMAAALLADLQQTVSRLRALGKRVLLIAPPPRAGFNVAACLERRTLQRWRLGAPPDCRIELQAPVAGSAAVQAWLAQAEALLPVLRFEPLLCHAGRCEVEQAGVMLYRDQGHLSHAGSALLLPQLDWAAAGPAGGASEAVNESGAPERVPQTGPI